MIPGVRINRQAVAELATILLTLAVGVVLLAVV